MRFKLTKKGINIYQKYLVNKLNYTIKQFTQKVFELLKINSPVKSGYLVSRYTLIDGKMIENDTEYLWYVNNGTLYIKGQHFIQLSIQQAKMQLQKILDKQNK